jgi:hypothetical protein
MTRTRIVLLALALSAPFAVAQHWDIEQVDSAGWGASVDMRWHPDGRLFLCYSDTSGVIRLASKDSVWSYENLPQWRPTRSGSQAFDIDLRGDIGVSYIGTDNLYWYALKTDTGWADIQTPFNAGPYYPSLTSLDTSGAPAICVQHGDAYLLARMRDTAWVTYALADGFSGWTNDFDCSALGSMDDVVWGVFRYTGTFPIEGAYFCSLNRFQARDSDVSVVQIASAVGWIPAASGCVDARDSVHSCYYNHGELYLDQTAIDTTRAERTAVKFDSLDRPQIAYTRRDSGLMYRCRTPEVWHVFDLHTGGVTALSLIIGESAQPLIAYTTSEGVFLLHGVDVVGQSEEQGQPMASGSRLTASVVRNVLLLPEASSLKPQAAGWLLDAAGCRALDLRPGANDVGGLSPGVYFVREAQAQAQVQTQAVRKVVITR